MKIITDKFLLSRRIALQDILAKKLTDLGFYMKIYKSEVAKNPKKEKEFYLRFLRQKVQSIALIDFELEYGDFFLNQDIKFRNAVIDEVTGECVEILKAKPDNEVAYYGIEATLILLERSLKKQIKKFNISKS